MKRFDDDDPSGLGFFLFAAVFLFGSILLFELIAAGLEGLLP